jgi:hypothetical protein
MKGQAPFLASVPPATLSVAKFLVVGIVAGPVPHFGAVCFSVSGSSRYSSYSPSFCLADGEMKLG